MVRTTDFHTVVFDYLSLSLDRKEFTLRIAALLAGIEKAGDPPAIKLGNAIYSDLVLAIAGAIPENALRTNLAGLFTEVDVLPNYRDKEPPSFLVKKPAPSDYDPESVVLV